MPLALVVRENKKLVLEELPLPACGPRDLLIKVTHVAQNPTDWKYVEYHIAKPGSMIGRDFAGEIVEVGAEAVGNYRKGEHVAGSVQAALDYELGFRGAYSEYVVQEASLVFRYPSTISPESAATMPVGSTTAALGLFHEMKLPLPPAHSQTPVLIWGGSTSVGQYAIQLARAAGCFVITTASSARHNYMKELGADICFDYKDSNVVSQIKQATKTNLTYAFDCNSEKESVKQVCETLVGQNPRIVTLLPGLSSEIPSNIEEHNVIVTTIYGRKFNIMNEEYEVKLQDKEFAEQFYQLLSNTLLPNYLLKPNKVAKIPNGLNGVEDGFKRMKEKKVTAEKLVITIAETTVQ